MSALTIEASDALLSHILNDAAWPNVGDAAGLPAGTVGSLSASAHPADPGTGGSQGTNEIPDAAVTRVPLARDGTWWSIAAGTATSLQAITFPAATTGPNTVTFIGIGTAPSGSAGHLLFRVAITSPAAGLVLNAGIVLSVGIGAATINDL